MKSGNLNFLEPSGPLQACNGIALPFTTTTATTATKHGFLSKMAPRREVRSVQFRQGRAVYLLYLFGLKIEA